MNHLVCAECNNKYPLNEKIWHYACGGLLDIDYSSIFPIDKITQRKKTMWRYREAIPIENE